MAPDGLPLPADELARRLSHGLVPSDPRELVVTDLVLVEDGDTLAVRMAVIARVPDRSPERWRVTLPVDRTDLEPDVDVRSLVVVLRANLEEWWDCKEAEPAIAAWGSRLE